MIKSMLALAKMQYKQYTAYKSNFYLFTANRFVEIIVFIFIWKAIYNQTGDAGGFTVAEMITYYVLATVIKPFVLWGINEDIAHSIRNGKINKELLNPLTYFQYCFGINIGEMLYGLIISITTFTVCCVVFGVIMPVNVINFAFVIIIILLGIPITFFIQMIVGTVGFYSSSIWGMEILKNATLSIFSGIIAPITLFPNWFQGISQILPFKDLVYTPVNVWLGKISTLDTLLIILKLIVWGFIMYGIARIFFNYSIKKITINGG